MLQRRDVHLRRLYGQGFGSASISCRSGSRVLKTDADADPDPDPDTARFLKGEKVFENFMYFFKAFVQI